MKEIVVKIISKEEYLKEKKQKSPKDSYQKLAEYIISGSCGNGGMVDAGDSKSPA
jgi:hypothetical protein